MYRNDYPEVDELVVVQVKAIVDMGAYCSLLEHVCSDYTSTDVWLNAERK